MITVIQFSDSNGQAGDKNLLIHQVSISSTQLYFITQNHSKTHNKNIKKYSIKILSGLAHGK